MPSSPSKRPRPSRLNKTQQRFLLLVVALGVFMLADTLYLLSNRLGNALHIGYFAATEVSMPKFYQGMVLSHTGVGLVLVALAAVFVLWHLPRVWRKTKKRAIYTGLATVGLGLALVLTGLFILSAAQSRDNAWAYWIHVGAALLIPIYYLLHRRASLWKPSRQSYRLVPGAVLVVLAVAIGLHGFTYDREQYTQEAEIAFAQGTHLGPGSKTRDPAQYADSDFVPANFVPAASPFFPAATTTTTGTYLPSRIITRGDQGQAEAFKRDLDQYGFVVSQTIGAESCVSCHAAITAQWSSSAHRFASFNNPFYEATINHMRQNATTSNPEVAGHIAHFAELAAKEGKVKSKWCSGCHDPALMLAGKMTEDIDRTSPQAQAGLTCLACHAIDQIHDQTGNGNYNIADVQEDPYLFAQARQGLGRFIHDTALKARPQVHQRQMLKPFFRTSEYCATCHKVSLDTRVNDYRWLRGQNEYDNWHDSGVALNASRTFYLPPTKRLCQDCHMPLEEAVQGDASAKDGYVRSHRFLGANTALPYLRGDQETIDRTEAFLQTGKLRLDIFALRRPGEETQYALDLTQPLLQPGDSFEFDIIVRNLGVGHTFPGGTNDSNEGWLEIEIVDAQGQVLAASGYLQQDGHVDPAGHFYKALLVDKEGQPIHRRNAQDIVTKVYTRTIGPGTADAAHYSFQLPTDYDGAQLTLRARLLWRKFDRRYTEFAYRNNPQGFAAFDQVPDLPITQIASAEVALPVGAAASRSQPLTANHWMRFNDYGIGLLLQDDTQGAAQAFARVAELAPQRLDGPRNLARTALRDGNLEEAYTHLRRCEELEAGNAQTAWVWGVVLQEDGRYPEAAAAYRRVLHDFPEDRAAWRNLGRVLYLDGQFEEALEALGETLAIDPEDRIAHYHRMLALRALDREDEALVAEQAYQYYQIDESAQELTRRYRLDRPHDNRETQAIHVHALGMGQDD
ncbi:MAG: tetratricopeptide repeat protein [Candidatus Latescibacteria bacterium]|nr:tetratricopeptide repeat protein [Candidatus Latescibacterota bacterium]